MRLAETRNKALPDEEISAPASNAEDWPRTRNVRLDSPYPQRKYSEDAAKVLPRMLMVLGRRSFALVWAGGLVSLAGDRALITGLPLVVYQMTGSTLALGLTLMANALPRVAVGSIAGVFVDRWDRRKTMLVADLLLGLGCCLCCSSRVWPVHRSARFSSRSAD
jgi:hypothetical protein